MNSPQWQGQRPFQEVWYCTFNDATRGYWFRYTLLAQQNKNVLPILKVWAFIFDPAQKKIFQFQKAFPCQPSHFKEGVVSAGKENIFHPGHLEGNIDQKIQWHISYSKNGRAVDLFPAWLKKIPSIKTRFIIPYQDTQFSGSVEIENLKFQFKDAPGTQGHIWGNKHAYQWIWGHCNQLNEAGYSFEILAAKPFSFFPFLTFGYLKTPEKEYFFQAPWKNRIRPFDQDCQFRLIHKEICITGKIKVDPADQVKAIYTNTFGKDFFCYNSELASLELNLTKPGAFTHHLSSRHTMHFEFTKHD
ncbi:MAG: hypothetical protein HY390_01730 [Deltaproteobacteria bacterium]|nr:hypothetical protein [Deltaproteobacteria bacterium]